MCGSTLSLRNIIFLFDSKINTLLERYTGKEKELYKSDSLDLLKIV